MSIVLDNISYKYNPGTTYEQTAFSNISLTIEDGEFVGIIGHTGSGKSTLIQHLNGLLTATEGAVYYNGENIYDPSYDKKDLRTQVGMVFQYPEHQLFEATVFEDVKFGPKNQGLDDGEASIRAYEALKNVGFADEYFEVSPFELSGGQKRRAAIAGVMAMKPAVIILDEPTAGLDPTGRDEILDLIDSVHKRSKNTVVLVSHSMEDIAKYVDRLIVIDDGKIRFDDTPKEVFKNYSELEEMGLSAPRVRYVMNALRREGIPVDGDITTVDEAVEELVNILC